MKYMDKKSFDEKINFDSTELEFQFAESVYYRVSSKVDYDVFCQEWKESLMYSEVLHELLRVCKHVEESKGERNQQILDLKRAMKDERVEYAHFMIDMAQGCEDPSVASTLISKAVRIVGKREYLAYAFNMGYKLSSDDKADLLNILRHEE